jgi:hypothetical protein
VQFLDLAYVLPLVATRIPDSAAVIGGVAVAGQSKAAVIFKLITQPSLVFEPTRPGIAWSYTNVTVWSGPSYEVAAEARAAAQVMASRDKAVPADLPAFVRALDPQLVAAWRAGKPPLALLQKTDLPLGVRGPAAGMEASKRGSVGSKEQPGTDWVVITLASLVGGAAARHL